MGTVSIDEFAGLRCAWVNVQAPKVLLRTMTLCICHERNEEEKLLVALQRFVFYCRRPLR